MHAALPQSEPGKHTDSRHCGKPRELTSSRMTRIVAPNSLANNRPAPSALTMQIQDWDENPCFSTLKIIERSRGRLRSTMVFRRGGYPLTTRSEQLAGRSNAGLGAIRMHHSIPSRNMSIVWRIKKI